jgi:hypothetical protein
MGFNLGLAAMILNPAGAAAGFLSPFTQTILSGARGLSSERDALRRQEDAQRIAAQAALRQQQQNQEAQGRQNRRAPDPFSILGDQQGAASMAMASVLTGPLGIANDRLKLGGPTSLLGT